MLEFATSCVFTDDAVVASANVVIFAFVIAKVETVSMATALVVNVFCVSYFGIATAAIYN